MTLNDLEALKDEKERITSKANVLTQLVNIEHGTAYNSASRFAHFGRFVTRYIPRFTRYSVYLRDVKCNLSSTLFMEGIQKEHRDFKNPWR